MTLTIGTTVVRIVNKDIPHTEVYLWTGDTIYIGFNEQKLNYTPTSGFKLPANEVVKIEYRGDIFAVSTSANQSLEVMLIPDIGQKSL